MKLGDGDRIVPWLHAHYELGRIQHDWDLSMNLSNPTDGRAEVVLYRDDSEIGKSMYLWNLKSPNTDISILENHKKVVLGHLMGLRQHDDGFRRSDYFDFNRDPCDEKRCWGTLCVSVEDKKYEIIVPSSVYKHRHGVADPDNAAMIPVGRNELGYDSHSSETPKPIIIDVKPIHIDMDIKLKTREADDKASETQPSSGN